MFRIETNWLIYCCLQDRLDRIEKSRKRWPTCQYRGEIELYIPSQRKYILVFGGDTSARIPLLQWRKILLVGVHCCQLRKCQHGCKRTTFNLLNNSKNTYEHQKYCRSKHMIVNALGKKSFLLCSEFKWIEVKLVFKKLNSYMYYRFAVLSVRGFLSWFLFKNSV